MFVVGDKTQNSRNCNAARKPLEVQLCAARCHELYPLWSILPRSVLLLEYVFCDFLWQCVSAVLLLYRPAKMTDVKEQRICKKFCFKLYKTASETHSMREKAFGDSALGQTQTYEWFKRFKKWWISFNEEEFCWRPSTEPQPKMWQTYGTESIEHKIFVRTGQTVNGKFYCGVVKRMTGSTGRKRLDNWRNNFSALHHDNAPAGS